MQHKHHRPKCRWTLCTVSTFCRLDLLLWLLVILSDLTVPSFTRVKYSTRNVRWWSKNSSLSFWLDKRTSSTDCVTVLKNPLSFSLLFLPRTLSYDSTHNVAASLTAILTRLSQHSQECKNPHRAKPSIQWQGEAGKWHRETRYCWHCLFGRAPQ